MKFHFTVSKGDINLINALLKMRNITESKLDKLGINSHRSNDVECPIYITSEEGYDGGNFGVIYLKYESLPLCESFYIMKCEICDESGLVTDYVDNYVKLESFNEFKVGNDTFILHEDV